MKRNNSGKIAIALSVLVVLMIGIALQRKLPVVKRQIARLDDNLSFAAEQCLSTLCIVLAVVLLVSGIFVMRNDFIAGFFALGVLALKLRILVICLITDLLLLLLPRAGVKILRLQFTLRKNPVLWVNIGWICLGSLLWFSPQIYLILFFTLMIGIPVVFVLMTVE